MSGTGMVFKKDGIYFVTPTKVLATAKVVNSQKCGKCYKYELEVVDDDGTVGVGEYLCKIGQEPEFKQGIKCKATCIWLSDVGTPTLAYMASENTDIADCAQRDPAEEFNQYSVNVGGASIVFAFGFAKDLLVAEVGKQKAGYKITPEDIRNLIERANTLNDAITDRIKF